MNVECAEKLLPIYTTDKRFIVIAGGRGSAKSWGVGDYCPAKGLERKRRILCVREVQNSIKDSVHKLLSDRIEFHGLHRFYNITEKSIIGANGTEFIFKGLYRNINDIKSTEGIDICWAEEAQNISRASLDILIPTVFRKPGCKMIFVYNPTNEDDPVHTDFWLADRPDTLKIEMNYMDNPWFPKDLRELMEYDRSHDYDKYRHVWLGKPVAHSDAQIFKGRWHVEEFIADDKTFFYFGSDFGFSQDPTTLIRCFVKDNQLYIDYEVYKIGLEINHIPAAYNTIPESSQFHIFGDSSRPDTISYLRNHGYPKISGVEKGKGSVEDGIEFIKSFDKIIIHPRCQHTIDEFRLYSYVTDKHTGLISNKIEDKHNHMIDALRYALVKLIKQKRPIRLLTYKDINI